MTSIPGNSQLGQGSEQPDPVKDAPDHCRGRWTRQPFTGPFWPRPSCDSTILWLYNQATKQDLRTHLRAWARLETTISRKWYLCHLHTALSPGAGFHFCFRAEVFQSMTGKVAQAWMYRLLPSKHHYQELSYLQLRNTLQMLRCKFW